MGPHRGDQLVVDGFRHLIFRQGMGAAGGVVFHLSIVDGLLDMGAVGGGQGIFKLPVDPVQALKGPPDAPGGRCFAAGRYNSRG